MKQMHEVIDETLRVYTLVLPQTVLLAAVGALVGGIPLARVTAELGHPPDFTKLDWSAYGWALVFQILVGLLVQGSMLKMIAMRVRNGVELPLTEALHAGMAMMPTMLLATLWYFVLVLACSVLLVLPGIWMLVAGMFCITAIALEGCDAQASVARSQALVKGRWWNTFGLLLLSGLITMLGYLLLATFISPLANFAFGGGWTTEATLNTVLGALFTPLYNALLVVLFLEYAGTATSPPAPSEIAA